MARSDRDQKERTMSETPYKSRGDFPQQYFTTEHKVCSGHADLGPLFEGLAKREDDLAEDSRKAVPTCEAIGTHETRADLLRELADGAYFDGPEEEDPASRTQRLGGQLADIFQAIQDGGAYSLEELSSMTGHPEASVSAQLRHLRKQRFGSFVVIKKHEGRGLYRYRLDLRPDGTPERADGSGSGGGRRSRNK